MAKTVLVIDDDADFLELLDVVLTAEGYTFVPCPDPAQVQQKALEWHPDVILVDLYLPQRSGWQIIEQLRSDLPLAKTRIVVCTAALSEVTLNLAALRRWQCGVLLKPFEFDDLLAILAQVAAQGDAS